ncbi:MAG: hypothetical protein KGZ59_03925 [Chitinophagaceae bacterium]|nr:hypothetical protein [Chitinophagaceae bacterium]
MNIDTVVKNFRLFILSSWDSFLLFNEPESTRRFEENTDNWLQANWEVLVEAKLTGVNEFLEAYGNGADCNSSSSRICYADKLPTHRIKCANTTIRDIIKNKKIVIENMYFDRFISIENKYPIVVPPFDYVLLTSDDDTAIVSVNEVIFELEKI